MADGMEDTVADDSRQQLLDVEGQQDGADGGKEEVMDQEECLQLVRIPVAHPFSATEDDRVIADDEDPRFLQRRHRSLAGLEPEFLSRVADDSGPSLVEDGP